MLSVFRVKVGPFQTLIRRKEISKVDREQLSCSESDWKIPKRAIWSVRSQNLLYLNNMNA